MGGLGLLGGSKCGRILNATPARAREDHDMVTETQHSTGRRDVPVVRCLQHHVVALTSSCRGRVRGNRKPFYVSMSPSVPVVFVVVDAFLRFRAFTPCPAAQEQAGIYEARVRSVVGNVLWEYPITYTYPGMINITKFGTRVPHRIPGEYTPGVPGCLPGYDQPTNIGTRVSPSVYYPTKLKTPLKARQRLVRDIYLGRFFAPVVTGVLGYEVDSTRTQPNRIGPGDCAIGRNCLKPRPG